MNFKLACGHTVTIAPYTNWFTVIFTPCNKCLRDAIAARYTQG